MPRLLPTVYNSLFTATASISRRLKPFQLESLSWMIRQEHTHYKGGLLGDEMGMGKTIQSVSLIMSDYPAKEPTLVCVPPVALMRRSNEIRDYTENKLKADYLDPVAPSRSCSTSSSKEDCITLDAPHRSASSKRLIEDLACQLARRANDKHERLGTDAISLRVIAGRG